MTTILDLVRPSVREISPYTLAERSARIKLDQNESPFDLPRDLKEAAVARILERSWNRYPSFEQSTIRRRFAQAHGLSEDEILVGNGSNELLVAVMQAFVDADTTVIVARPSFSLYEHYSSVLGARILGVPVDLGSGALPVDAMVEAAATRRGRVVVFVCSPNNPTGSVLGEGELVQLLETGAVVVLDRAYGEFAGGELPSLHERLVVLSTFSKAFGLAGLRIGWLASAAGTVREIRKVKLPYNLNVASEEIALTALDDRENLLSILETIVVERERVAEEMMRLQVDVFPSAANFLLFRVGDAQRLFEALLDESILVRNVAGMAGLENCLRVSIGTRLENDAFLRVLEQVCGRRACGGLEPSASRARRADPHAVEVTS